MFKGNDLNNAMGVPFFYGACEAFIVGVYCVGCWKAGWSKAPRDAPFWKVIMTSYEIVAVHGDEIDGDGVLIDDEDPSTEKPATGHSNYVEMGTVNTENGATV